MRYSEFWDAVVDVFGDRMGRVLVDEQVVDALGDRTAAQALEAGEDPRAVWWALCDAMEVPDGPALGAGPAGALRSRTTRAAACRGPDVSRRTDVRPTVSPGRATGRRSTPRRDHLPAMSEAGRSVADEAQQ